MPRGRTSRTPEKRAQLLEAITTHGGNVTAAAKECAIGRQTVFDWKAADPEFKRQLEAAIDRGVDMLEDEARRRAFAGWDEPVYQKGELVGHVRRYDTILLIFMLKAHRPEKYRERVENINRDMPITAEGVIAGFSGLPAADQTKVLIDLGVDLPGTT